MSRYSLTKLPGQIASDQGVKWSVREGAGTTYDVVISPQAWTLVFGSDCSFDTLLFVAPAGVDRILAAIARIIDAGFPVEGRPIFVDPEDIL